LRREARIERVWAAASPPTVPSRLLIEAFAATFGENLWAELSDDFVGSSLMLAYSNAPK
jgi:hypothetical protein